jgi:hypothetical protein
MIAGVAAIVLTAVLSSLLVPLSMVALASCGLFPPILINVGGRRLIFRGKHPLWGGDQNRSSAPTSPNVATTYVLGQSGIASAYAAAATFTLFMHVTTLTQLDSHATRTPNSNQIIA